MKLSQSSLSHSGRNIPLNINNKNNIKNNNTYNPSLLSYHSQRKTSVSLTRQNCSHRRRRKRGSYGKIHGDPLGEKKSSDVRLVFENFNGLAAWKPWNEKVLFARKFLRRISADCYMGVECNVQWSLLQNQHQLRELFHSEVPVKAVSAFNEHEGDIRNQPGGTGIITFDKMTLIFLQTGRDTTGLGRWSWISATNQHQVTTRIISAYQPCRTKRQRFTTIYAQQSRFFQQHGDMRCPIEIFRQHLTQQLRQWREQGDRIILFLDANENLMSGPLQKQLTANPLNLQDLIKKRTNLPGPPTFARGKTQIDGVFATEDIICSGARFLPLWSGIGDHRPIVVDIPSACLYGREMLQVERPLARRLQCKFPQCQQKYTSKLTTYYQHHKIPTKIQRTIDLSTSSTSNYVDSQEAVDHEKTDLMKASEKRCRKYRMGAVDFSDEVIIWKHR